MGSFTLFRIGRQEFAIETESVAETIKIDRVFPVPGAGEKLEGVINLRNNVIPIFNGGKLIGGERTQSNTALLIEQDTTRVGILVEEVIGLEEIGKEEIRRFRKSDAEDIKREFVKGSVNRGEKVILIFNTLPLTGKRRSGKKKQPTGRHGKREVFTQEQDREKANKTGYVLFTAGEEWFGIPVKEVVEVIEYPSEVSKVPSSKDYVEGVFVLRDEQLTLISVSKLLGIEGGGQAKRAIVVKVGNSLAGLGVEEVKEIRWVEEREILRRDNSQEGFLALDGGRVIALLTSVRDLLREEDLQGADLQIEEEATEPEVREMKSFVNFEVGDLDLAVPVEKVKEVIEIEGVTPVPDSPDHIAGVYNLRNSVIVILSLSKRLGMEGEDSNRVIVLEEAPVGLTVRTLKGIIKVEEEDIHPVSELKGVAESLVEGVIRNERGVVFILSPEKLLEEEDLEEAVASLTAGGKADE